MTDKTSTAVFRLNEIEGRSSKEEESEARHGIYLCGERSCKIILAVNFLYITNKSISTSKEAGFCFHRRCAALSFWNPLCKKKKAKEFYNVFFIGLV